MALRASPNLSAFLAGDDATRAARSNKTKFGTGSESHPYPLARGFTLLEILLASLAAALILSAVYGIFQHALRLRDSGDRRIRASRLRARAESVIRADLQNALISGGILAATLSGDSAGTDTSNLTHTGAGNFPGYLKLTTTTGRDTSDDLYGDVQQVEYYIAPDPAASSGGASSAASGILMRSITRDLLGTASLSSAAQSTAAREEQILTGVQSFQVSFYDGANWQTTWQFSGLNTSATGTSATSSTSTTSSASSATAASSSLTGQTGLPSAVRIDIQQAPATPRDSPPPPLEVLVPWTTQPFAAATPATSTGTAATPTPTPVPNTPPPAPPAEPPSPGGGGRPPR